MVKEKFNRIKLYVNIGIIGYVDYGKMILSVVILVVFFLKGFVEMKDYDNIDNVFEEKERGIIIVIFYIEYEIENRYYAYVDCLGYVDYVKNMIIGVA